MPVYHYDGPVLNKFAKVITQKWTATTVAPSKDKALSQLRYRHDVDHGLAVGQSKLCKKYLAQANESE